MMSLPKNKKLRRAALGILLFSLPLLLSACSLQQAPVLHSDGPIAGTERDLLLFAAGVMLIVVIPVFVMAAWFAWHYRASNTSARYMPDWSFSPGIEAAVWLVPTAIVAVLGAMVWIYTGRLDPYRTLALKGDPPLQVEAISLDWKWLFIYPKQHIATVNELVVPTGNPVSIKLTSDTVMNSFYIPGLVGQIYTMAGMRTRLNMLADAPGHFTGLNTQYSGAGFSGQHFDVQAVTPKGFAAWIAKVRHAPKRLDAAAYAGLEKPSQNNPVTLYSAVEPHLFQSVIAKYQGPPVHAGRGKVAGNPRRHA
jgi:cytochrome o ubiquinol oxidase subunit II